MRHTEESVKRRRVLIAALVASVSAGVFLAWGDVPGSALVVRQPIARPDAIISLASHEWERLPVAARQVLQNPGSLLLLTVPTEIKQSNCHDCAERVDQLRGLGVDRTRIRVLSRTVRDTNDEAIAAFEFARRTGIHSVLVVTSPYHTRRALAIFRKVFEGSGVRVGVEPALETSPATPPRWWGASYDRRYVAYEWTAILYYGWKHGLRPRHLMVAAGD